MLKDRIEEEYKRRLEESQNKDKDMSDDMNTKFRGELEIWELKGGKIISHQKDSNIVTNWAKHATMHLLTSESYTTHGNRATVDGYTTWSQRSLVGSDHVAGNINNDGTLMSGEQYFGNNNNYYKYWSGPDNISIDAGKGDFTDPITPGFTYPFFPTKLLFGTGSEYTAWNDSTVNSVVSANRDGNGQDGYGNSGNGSWDETKFNEFLTTNTNISNYYSAAWNAANYSLLKTRTMNDVYAGALDNTINPMTEDNFGVRGAIKNGDYTDVSQLVKLADTNGDGKYLSANSYKGIGLPAFIYPRRSDITRFMSGGEVALELGTNVGTEHLESKITYTVEMPDQTNGEFYPYNGFTLKVAGLFADSAMLLRNDVPPSNNSDNDDVNDLEYTSYAKMPSGLLWATRNITPIYKGHDTSIVARWTIYL